jgi:hypothetical protein
VLVDSAARKQHAAFGGSDFRGELANFLRSDAGERRGPLRRIAALEDEVAPALPAFDPALAERQVVQCFREDLVRERERQRKVGAAANRKPPVGLARGDRVARDRRPPCARGS